MISLYVKNLWQQDKWIHDQVLEIEAGVLRSIENVTASDDASFNDIEWIPYLIPGLIDIHTHGAMWQTANKPDTQQFSAWTFAMASHGVTGFLPTIYTDEIETMREAINIIAQLMKQQEQGILAGAKILGIHLEGPFVTDHGAGLGTMDPLLACEASPDVLQSIVGNHWDCIKLVTLAPELPRALETYNFLHEKGIPVHVGHSNIDYETGKNIFSSRFEGVCHFFNAAPSLHHRNLSWLLAAMEESRMMCEVIADNLHVKAPMRKLLEKIVGPDRIIYISDALFVAGLSDGEYALGDDQLYVSEGLCRLADGRIYGGSSFMGDFINAGEIEDDAFSFLIQACSINPSRHLGLGKSFGLTLGQPLACTALNQTGRIQGTWIDEIFYPWHQTKQEH